MSTDQFFRFLFISGLLFLAFMAGSIAVYFQYIPYKWIHQAAMAYHAENEKYETVEKTKKQPPVKVNRQPRVVHKEGAYEGYTLLSTYLSTAILVDMNGTIVHSWHRDFSKTWPNPPHVPHPMPDKGILWFGAQLFPNGDLLIVSEATGDTPNGYGLAKIDKNSRVIWKYDANVNHVFDVDEKNGDIYALVHNVVDARSILGPDVQDRRILEDNMVILSKDGKELKRISLLKALANSPYKALLQKSRMRNRLKVRHRNKAWDIMHTNSVYILRPKMAAHFPMFKPGQVLISMRNINAIGVLDLNTEKFVWLDKGSWRRQHDAEFVNDGTIMLFDNLGAKPYSRLLKYHPDTKETDTVFSGTAEKPFFTHVRGMQQQLPNGNILLNESDKGHVIEITPSGTVVWRITNPFLRGRRPAPVATALRYGRDEVPFLDAH